ncbi:MAG: thioredoxin family protein [Planctomycetes bacterium]|nr:thioredoxin family protein [Planctomycetota bacterium]
MHFLSIALLWLAALFGSQQPKAKLEFFARTEGSDVRAVVRLKIAPRWHLYGTELGNPTAVGLPTELSFQGAGVTWGAPRWPKPEVEKQPFGQDGEPTTANIYHGTVLVYVAGRLAEGAQLGEQAVQVTGQTCEEGGQCIQYDETAKLGGAGADALFEAFPGDLKFVAVAPSASGDDDQAPTTASAGEDDFEEFEDPEAHARVELFTRAEGGDALAVLRIEIDDTWHLFHETLGTPDAAALPTVIKFGGAEVQWGKIVWPEPHKAEQEYGLEGKPTWVWQHEGTLELYARGKLAPGADVGALHVTVTGQTCDASFCTPFRAAVESSGRGPDALFAKFPSASAFAAARATDNASSSGGTARMPVKDTGLLEFLGLAVAWGFVALLMPCTYPMIPITVSFFTKQSSHSRGRQISLALLYGLGIVVIFILIGLVVGKPIMKFATSPVTNLVIGGFFLIFALSLMGLFTLQPPAFLMSAAGKARMTGGYLGVFLMGATLVVTSFTCTAPFVGSLLSVGASGGNWMRIVLGMGTFGLTMAIPFVALSLVPGKLSSMPRAGEWMNTLKVTLGLVELAAALKFFSNADVAYEWHSFPREMFFAFCAAIFVVAAAYLFGLIRLHGESGEIGSGRLVTGLGFALLSSYCVLGTAGYSLDFVTAGLAPPYGIERPGGSSGALEADKKHEIVVDDYAAALARAKQLNRRLMVNFTGHQCTNCRSMEGTVLGKDPAQSVLREHYVEARLHNDGKKDPELTERILELQEKLTHNSATPHYLVIDPQTERIIAEFPGADLPPVGDGSNFLQFLRGALP